MAKYDLQLNLHFAALADPTRRAILNRLARGKATVSELAAPHDMALPSFIGHLKKLEDAGLIATKKQGRVRTCMLAPDGFIPAQEWLMEQKSIWDGRLDRFDDYILNLTQEKNQ